MKKIRFWALFCTASISVALFPSLSACNSTVSNDIILSEWREESISYLTTKNSIDFKKNTEYSFSFKLQSFKRIDSKDKFYITFEGIDQKLLKFNKVSATLNKNDINNHTYIQEHNIEFDQKLNNNDELRCIISFANDLNNAKIKFSSDLIDPTTIFSLSLAGDDKKNVESTNNEMISGFDFSTTLTSKVDGKPTVVVKKATMGGKDFSSYNFNEVTHIFSVLGENITDNLVVFVEVTDRPPIAKFIASLAGPDKDNVFMSNSDALKNTDFKTTLKSKISEKPIININGITIGQKEITTYDFQKVDDETYSLSINGNLIDNNIIISVSIKEKEKTTVPVVVKNDKGNIKISKNEAEKDKDFTATLSYEGIETKFIIIKNLVINGERIKDYTFDKKTFQITISGKYIKGDVLIYAELQSPQQGDELKVRIAGGMEDKIRILKTSAYKDFDFESKLEPIATNSNIQSLITINKIEINGYEIQDYIYNLNSSTLHIDGCDVTGDIVIYPQFVSFYEISLIGDDKEKIEIDTNLVHVNENLKLKIKSLSSKMPVIHINEIKINDSSFSNYEFDGTYLTIESKYLNGDVKIDASAYLSLDVVGRYASLVSINTKEAKPNADIDVILSIDPLAQKEKMKISHLIIGDKDISSYEFKHEEDNIWKLHINSAYAIDNIQIEPVIYNQYEIFGGSENISISCFQIDNDNYFDDFIDNDSWVVVRELQIIKAQWKLDNFTGSADVIKDAISIKEEQTATDNAGRIHIKNFKLTPEQYEQIKQKNEGSFDVVGIDDLGHECQKTINLNIIPKTEQRSLTVEQWIKHGTRFEEDMGTEWIIYDDPDKLIDIIFKKTNPIEISHIAFEAEAEFKFYEDDGTEYKNLKVVKDRSKQTCYLAFLPDEYTEEDITIHTTVRYKGVLLEIEDTFYIKVNE